MTSIFGDRGAKGFKHHPLAVGFIHKMAAEGLDIRTGQAVFILDPKI